MQRQRLMTHIGFGGHYQIVDHIGHVQVDDEYERNEERSVDSDLTSDDPSETSISEKVADFETARKIEETLARFPEARKRAEKAYVSKRSFTCSQKVDNVPSSLFTRNDNFALALSSVLKLCVEESAGDTIDPSISAASHPGTGMTMLSDKVEGNGFSESISGMSRNTTVNKTFIGNCHRTIDETTRYVKRTKEYSAASSGDNRSKNHSEVISTVVSSIPTKPTSSATSKSKRSPRAVRKEVTFSDSPISNEFPPQVSHRENGLTLNITQENGIVDNDCDDLAAADFEANSLARLKMKSLSNKLQSLKMQNLPISNILKAELNIQHANLNEIMQNLLEKSCNRLSDEKRLYLEESVLVVNGFNALDSDSDGLLSRRDFEIFFKKRKAKPPTNEIDGVLWLLDDNRRGYLALQDVQNYYFRVLQMFRQWTPVADLEKHLAIAMASNLHRPIFQIPLRQSAIGSSGCAKKCDTQSRGALSQQGVIKCEQFKVVDVENNPRYSLALLRSAMEIFTESVFLYRLILFAALENRDRKIHVLSALQQMVERFGPEVADHKFEQLFCRSAIDLQDSELLSLTELLTAAKKWDKKFEPYKVPLSPREKADIYIQYRNTELDTKMKQKLEKDGFDQLDLT